MNQALLRPDLQKFISENLSEDIPALILKGSPFEVVSIQELAAQISAKNKARTKLPEFFQKKDVLFPPNLNLEQTSSEITAKYKASQIKGKTGIDITGGFGIDTFYISRNFSKFLYCEQNQQLAELAAHNFSVLKATNLSIHVTDGIEFLNKTNLQFDWIYVDPSRRDEAGCKMVLLEDCSPNVIENMDLFFSKSSNILIKTSPLLDIQAGMKSLKNVNRIDILAVNNEVKELLWYLKEDFNGSPEIHCINYKNDKITSHFSGSLNDLGISPTFSNPLKFLYEPNAAVMKSQLFGLLSKKAKISKLQQNSHLYTSEKLIEFPGRRFKIIDVFDYNKKIFRRKDIDKANITTRNFPKSVEHLKKELKIVDGGNIYLFFTTNLENKKIVISCEQIFEDQ